ncbi:hypothetical protein SAMN04515691_4003 [Leifsonia sp. 98AMF]|nr:hypothetical protein SAMN04515690_0014 [Leifsonia sp. 197AMF]SDJ45761.1 hypothetical protein SAMN04515684_3769 [Leifsonia sp. 466MF]SDK29724.1 hypothetical protein SAMN04515683_2996 [Leifsonia sp. 157MF]SDN66108.1 hypothetical protein SAMN04515686_1956 [Leifsonia sp. 509MF]SEN42433.1 hypothetical protein SAMN04515685_2979 [Leifsonia sp. 467MF]SFM92225.1 hypothetical protein SAMN04515691_4003 [Leifsonia sp. 98AMF]
MSGHTWTNTYLYYQTEDLAALGWAAAPDLHLIRKTNNDDKHGTPVTATAVDIFDAISRIEQSTPLLEPLVPGLQQDALEPRLRRIVCAIYDHFAQGETEFALLEARPSETWMTARALDTFQINASDDKKARAELEALEGWEYDPPAFQAFAISLQDSDDELWRIAVFTSQYEDVYSILSSYQHKRALLPGLHRDDDALNVLSTLSMVQARTLANGGQLMKASDLLAASINEGLVTRRPDLISLADVVVRTFGKLAPEVARAVRVDRANTRVFESEQNRSPLAADPEFGVLVSPEGVLFVRTGN